MLRALRISTLLLALAAPTIAATFAVGTAVDGHDATPGNGICETQTGNGTCTLRAAVEETSALGGAQTIDLPAGRYVLSVTGACNGVALCVTGTPTLTVSGAGATTTIVDANAASSPPNGFGRVFDVAGGPAVTVTGVTFTNGASQPPFPGGEAGGIRNAGTLTLSDSVVSNSSGGYGGGLYNTGTLTLLRTIVSGNTALISYQAGGGIVNDAGTVTLTHSAFRNNHAGANGGGIFNTGTMTFNGCEISGNVSDGTGGGLENNNFSVATLTNTTVSGNASGSSGGGINLYNSAIVNLNNVTITANTSATSNSSGAGGGINNSGATANVKNTIIAGNANVSGGGPDCFGPLTSQGYNLVGNAADCTGVGVGTHDLIGVAPQLDALATNSNASGPTQTHALLLGSPAIDAGNPATPGSGGDACTADDQRGVARGQTDAGPCDIGAYEAVPRPGTTTTTTAVSPTSTTTSTTLPMCTAEPTPRTFGSVRCRLDLLLARLGAEPGLGSLTPKLAQTVGLARSREADAEKLCRASNLKKTKKRLQQCGRALIQYVRRLKTAKKTDPALRASLVVDGTSIKDGAKTLRGAVQCPTDAPSA